MVSEPYNGINDIRDVSFVIYNKEKIGRGFNLTVFKNYDIELYLNFSAIRVDIESFYNFINELCTYLEVNSFIQEGIKYSIGQIEYLKNETINFNKKLLKDNLEKGFTVFGAVYPIDLEDKFIEEVKSSNEDDACTIYENYLNTKQQKDYYFVKPLIYSDENNNLFAKYVLTEKVASIFSKRKYIPFGYNQIEVDDIKE